MFTNIQSVLLQTHIRRRRYGVYGCKTFIIVSLVGLIFTYLSRHFEQRIQLLLWDELKLLHKVVKVFVAGVDVGLL